MSILTYIDEHSRLYSKRKIFMVVQWPGNQQQLMRTKVNGQDVSQMDFEVRVLTTELQAGMVWKCCRVGVQKTLPRSIILHDLIPWLYAFVRSFVDRILRRPNPTVVFLKVFDSMCLWLFIYFAAMSRAINTSAIDFISSAVSKRVKPFTQSMSRRGSAKLFLQSQTVPKAWPWWPGNPDYSLEFHV